MCPQCRNYALNWTYKPSQTFQKWIEDDQGTLTSSSSNTVSNNMPNVLRPPVFAPLKHSESSALLTLSQTSNGLKNTLSSATTVCEHGKAFVSNGIRFVKAHPMDSVEEFVQYSLARSGRYKQQPQAEPEQESELEPEPEPEEGGRSRRVRKPVNRCAKSISHLHMLKLSTRTMLSFLSKAEKQHSVSFRDAQWKSDQGQ